MPNNNKFVLYILISLLNLIVSCLVLVLPLNAMMQWKQMLHEEGDLSLHMSIIVSYIKMIPSSWLFMIASFCIYRVSFFFFFLFLKFFKVQNIN